MTDWIPTKTRLPPKGVGVLVCDSSDGYIVVAMWDGKHFIEIDGWEYNDTDMDYWQPLPEPPKA